MEIAQSIIDHPAFGSLLATLLGLWPLSVVFRRAGLNPWLALLLLPNMALPGVGYILSGFAFLFLKPKADHKAVTT